MHRWNGHIRLLSQSLDDAILSLDGMCSLADQLARRLLAHHILFAGLVSDEVGWIAARHWSEEE